MGADPTLSPGLMARRRAALCRETTCATPRRAFPTPLLACQQRLGPANGRVRSLAQSAREKRGWEEEVRAE
eukprot:62325-Rhodomonas_salina.1